MDSSGRDTFCEWFPKRSSLTELNIVDIHRGFKGAEKCLRDHGKLQRFTLRGLPYSSQNCEAFSLLESLSFNRDLCYLNLSRLFYNQAYTRPISQLITSLPLLTDLDLEYNHLDHTIGDALRQNSVLTTLNLYGCLEQGDIAKVCEALHDHPTLTWLSLGNSSYQGGKETISAVAKLLQSRTPLQTVYFGNVQHRVEIRNLTESLKNNHTLTFLSLANVWCENEGAIAFAECLGINTTLTELDLSGNGIGDDGVIAIAKSLEKNTSLKMLDISDNPLNNEVLDCLLHMLDINTTLTHLNIIGCKNIEEEQKTRAKENYGKRISV